MTEENNNPNASTSTEIQTERSPRFWHHYQRYPYLLAKVALYGVVVYAVVWSLQNVQSVLFPLFLSLLIAYCLDPVVDWFEERGINRTFGIIIIILASLVFATVFILILYPALAKQVSQISERLPEIVDVIQNKILPYVEEWTGTPIPDDLSTVLAEYGDQIREQIPSVTEKVGETLGAVLNQTGTIVTSVLNAVMVPIFTFYFLRDFDRMKDPLVEFIPHHRRSFVMKRLGLMDEVVGAWFRGQVEVALILAVLYAIGLGIVFNLAGLGTMTGVAIGVLTGLLNVIPYFGFLIGVVLSTTLVLLNWDGPGALIGTAGVFLAVQGLEGYVITPRVVGDKVGLSPVTVIIVLLLGGELFGLLGVLLAIPVAGIVRALLPDLIAYYQTTPFYTDEFRGPDEEPDWMDSIAHLRKLITESEAELDVEMATEAQVDEALEDLNVIDRKDEPEPEEGDADDDAGEEASKATEEE